MKITQALFSGSSQRLSDRPKLKAPEFAFIGRSNVGKSSLINMLCQQKNLAHTSQKPGKTQLINHFLINDKWYLVDLPGYGYAKTSKSTRDRLSKMIQDYVNLSQEMAVLFVLIDSRHDLQKIDLDFLITLGEGGIPFAIVFTKCDKLGPNALKAQVDKIKTSILEYWEELPPCFASSSETAAGREEILDYIGSVLSKLDPSPSDISNNK